MRLPHLGRPRLSYANVTATLALVLATSTGGAYAATMIGSSQIKDNAVKSRHIARGNVHTSDLHGRAVTRAKLRDGAVSQAKLRDGAVSQAKLGDGAVTQAKLDDGAVSQAKLGSDVAAGRAYGTIWGPGTSVTGSHNLSVDNVTHPATGVYCIQGLGFTPSIAVASSAFEPNAFHHDIEIYGLGNNWGNTAPCPTASQIQVHVYQPGTTTAADGNFNIVIY